MGVTLSIFQAVTAADFDSIETPYILEDIEFSAGDVRNKSFLVYSSLRYMRVSVINNDAGQALVDLDVDVVEI